MNNPLNRREFAIRASAGVAGLMTGALLGGGLTYGQDPASHRLVLLGLNALARAHEMNYFTDGHRGASLVAAHLLCVENQLDPQATARIVELFDLNWAPTPLCKPFPDAESNPLRQVGHNAIFAMLAINAFRLQPGAATPQRIDGVCHLIRSMTPWREGPPDKAIDPPPFVETAAAAQFILREADAAIDWWVGFGQGFTGHLLTFGHALVELAAMGDVELAESCRPAFCKYVTIVRRGPDADSRRIADHKPSPLRPRDAKYWQSRGDKAVDIGHVFKYPYSYYDLLRYANDPELQQTLEAKAYHLF